MIPKKIHYCWFGTKPLGKSEEKCISSWKKHCPDYEIIRWNEEKFDIENAPEFVKDAYTNKNFAFVSDYVRLVALYSEGGVYMDTDVEVLKCLDPLMAERAFFGFENNEFVNTGQMAAAEKGHPCLKAMMEIYRTASFFNDDGTKNILGCPIVNTEALEKFGLLKNGEEQVLDEGIHIYPSDYFNPYNPVTDTLNKTANTYSVHWYSMSWFSPARRMRAKLLRPVHKILGR